MTKTGALRLTTPTDREVVMTREFNAPRELVFQALTKPELLLRWFDGPPGWSLVVCEIDLRVGGSYRYVWQGPNGVKMGMGGIYREITPPERIVQTEKFDESWYPGEALTSTELTEEDGKTTLTLTVAYDSKEARDAVLKTRMAEGVAATYDKLADLLPSLV